jgi:hypothetical protein
VEKPGPRWLEVTESDLQNVKVEEQKAKVLTRP